MRIHQNKHHYRTFQKNPFAGTGMPVFMAEAPKGPEFPPALMTDTAPEWRVARGLETTAVTAFKKNLEERKKTQTESGAESRVEMDAALERKWNGDLSDYNAVQNYITWLKYQKTCIENPEQAKRRGDDGEVRPFNLRDSVWTNRVEGIYRAYEEGMAAMTALGITPPSDVDIHGMPDPSRLNTPKELAEAKVQILQDCAYMVLGLESAKIEIEKELKKNMREDFEARVRWIQEQWRSNPPKDFEGQDALINSQTEFLDKVIESINKPEVAEQSLQEYAKLWNDITNLELTYIEGKRADEYVDRYAAELSKDALEAQLRELDEQRKEYVKQHEEENNREWVATRDALVAYIAQVEALEDTENNFGKGKEEGTTGKARILEGLKKQLAELNGWKGLDETTKAVLFSTEPHQAKAYADVSDEVGRDITIPKGFEGQLAYIFDDSNGMRPGERRALAMGLHQAIQKYKNQLLTPGSAVGNLVDMRKKIQENSEKIQKNQVDAQPIKGGYSVYFVAPYDAVRAWEIVSGWWDRTYQRRVTKRISALGLAALGPLSEAPWPLTPFRTLPNEYNKQGEDAERNEVQQFQDAYGNKDAWQQRDIAVSTRNQDEFKACLNLLSGNGRLRWDDEELLKQFNRFQNMIVVDTDPTLLVKNPAAFYDKLDRASGFIWDNDAFKGWKTNNDSNYNNKGKNYDSTLANYSETTGLETFMESMLKEWDDAKERGARPYFDPLLYDRTIGYSIEQGKMSPEGKLYYLLQGIERKIIPFERGGYYTSLNNQYPAIEIFGGPADHTGMGFPGKARWDFVHAAASMDRTEFDDWFHYYVMNLDIVRQRVDKTLTQGNRLDHDDLTPFFPYMGKQAIETALSKSPNGGYTVPQTGLENATASMEFYMRQFAEHQMNGADKQLTPDRLAEFIKTYVYFDGVLQDRYAKGDKRFFRFDSSARVKKPRASGNYEGMYGTKDQTVGENMDNVEAWILQLEPEFFSLLFKDGVKKAEIDKAVGTLADKYGVQSDPSVMFGGKTITTIEELYDSTGDFLNFIFSTSSGRAAFKGMCAKINEDNEAKGQVQKLRAKRNARHLVDRFHTPAA